MTILSKAMIAGLFVTSVVLHTARAMAQADTKNPLQGGRVADKKLGVFEELRAYYEKPNDAVVFEHIKRAAGQLCSKEPKDRREGATYLASLAAQALADETAKTAPWRATPYWGSSGENLGRKIREQVIPAVIAAPPAEELLPVLEWFLEHETMPRPQAEAADALAKIKGKAADSVLLRLVTPPHPNSVVLQTALTELAKRTVVVDASVTGKLCQHYRPSIRDAARKLHAARVVS